MSEFKDLIFKKVQLLDLNKTFNCGQAFRWKRQEDNSHIGVVDKYVVETRMQNNDLLIVTNAHEDFIVNYFDLNRNYEEINQKLVKLDDIMKRVVAYGNGIRILRQPKLETAISFIFSANNNIPRIKRTIERLTQNYGNLIEYKDKSYYTFPQLSQLINVKDFEFLKSGFRSKYLMNFLEFAANNSMEEISSLNTRDLKAGLMSVSGIGPKISDCILLFAYSRFDVFPSDVWIKRVMGKCYGIPESKISDFALEYFGENQGIAQQYLYYYSINNRKLFTD